MRKILFALFLLFGSMFALYQFDFQLTNVKHINISKQFENSEPNMMFYYDGVISIADSGVPGVIRYDTSDSSLSRMSSSMDSPLAIFMDSDGKTYVADDNAGLMRCWSCKNLYSDITPSGVSVYNDLVYASDKKNDRLLVVTKSGNYVAEFGRRGTLTNEFRTPMDMQFFNGTLYVADSGNYRVEHFTANFTHLGTYGSGKGDVSLLQPKGIFINSNYVYVADPAGGQVVAYTQDGYPVFVYSLNDSPTDVLIQGGKIYVSKHDIGMVLYADLYEPNPRTYVSGLLSSMSPYSKYAENSEVAAALGLSHNQTPASEWRNAKFAFDNGAYGEAFYKAMKLNGSVNIYSLNSNLAAQLNSTIYTLAQGSSAKSKIMSLLGQENYSGAYNAWATTSKPANSTQQNNTNVTNNQTVNQTGNQSAGTNASLLQARLDSLKENMSVYKITEDTSALESEIALAKNSPGAFDSAKLMLEALEQKVQLRIFKIDSALRKISLLGREIAQGGLFVDYSKAKDLMNSANSFAYYDPDKASSIADQGLAEAEKARSSANLIYIFGFALAGLAVLAAVVLIYFKDRIIRYGKRKDEYPGFKKR